MFRIQDSGEVSIGELESRTVKGLVKEEKIGDLKKLLKYNVIAAVHFIIYNRIKLP